MGVPTAHRTQCGAIWKQVSVVVALGLHKAIDRLLVRGAEGATRLLSLNQTQKAGRSMGSDCLTS